MSDDKHKPEITITHHVHVGESLCNGRPPEPPMAVAVRLSDAECRWIDEMRARSAALAVERGHVRR